MKKVLFWLTLPLMWPFYAFAGLFLMVLDVLVGIYKFFKGLFGWK